MPTPMDRDFGDDPVRLMQRRRMAKKNAWWPQEPVSQDIEAPILPQDQ